MSPKLHTRRKMLALGVVLDISVGLHSVDSGLTFDLKSPS
jgi:hypothetical protein